MPYDPKALIVSAFGMPHAATTIHPAMPTHPTLDERASRTGRRPPTRATRGPVTSREEFAKHLLVPTDWWIFFPLYGVQLRNERSPLERPLFGDATILSYGALCRAIRCAPDLVHDGTSSRKATLDLLEINRALAGDYHAAIGVRRRVALGKGGLRTPPPGALERAHRIGAALALAVASRAAGSQKTVSLVRRSPASAATRVLLAHAAGVYPIVEGERDEANGAPPAFSRRSLKSALGARDVASYTSVLTASRPLLPGSLQSAVTQASLRLADGVQSDEGPAQLLAAVTSLEVLLCDRTDYELLFHRVSVMAPEATARGSFRQILEARHRYVHGGVTDGVDDVKAAALRISMMVLGRYASLARTARSRADLLRLLDFELASRHVAADQRRMSAALHRLTPAGDP